MTLYERIAKLERQIKDNNKKICCISSGGEPGSGTVTSVGLTMPSAFTVASSPVTGSGTLAVSGAGNTSQYIRGNGTLAAFPAAYTLPTATTSVLGGVKIDGTTITISGGVISAVGGGGGSASLTDTRIAFGSNTNTITDSANLTWENIDKTLNIIKGSETTAAITIDRSAGITTSEIFQILPPQTYTNSPVWRQQVEYDASGNGDGTFNTPMKWGWFTGDHKSIWFSMEPHYLTQAWRETHLEAELTSSVNARLFSSTLNPSSGVVDTMTNLWYFSGSSFDIRTLGQGSYFSTGGQATSQGGSWNFQVNEPSNISGIKFQGSAVGANTYIDPVTTPGTSYIQFRDWAGIIINGGAGDVGYDAATSAWGNMRTYDLSILPASGSHSVLNFLGGAGAGTVYSYIDVDGGSGEIRHWVHSGGFFPTFYSNNQLAFTLQTNTQPTFNYLSGSGSGFVAVDNAGNLSWSAGPGGVVTANNGLNLSTATNVQLGGTLVASTTIDTTSAFNLTITSSNIPSGNAAGLIVTNTSSNGRAISAVATGSGGAVAIIAQSSNGDTINANATSGTALHGIATSGTGLIAQSTSGLAISGIILPSSTNTIVSVANLQRLTSGTAANGIGLSFDFINATTIVGQPSNSLVSKWTDATSATRTSQFIVTGVNNATTADLFTLSGNGAGRLNKYGAGTFTGTGLYYLQVDASGNIIEVPV